MSKSNLSEGAARMGRIVRAARERQRSTSGLDDIPVSAMNPSDAWARKYLSEGISPGMPRTAGQAPGLPDMPSQSRQAQFMRELKTKVGEPKRMAAVASGNMVMERPFAPTSAKHSGWAKLLRGK